MVSLTLWLTLLSLLNQSLHALLPRKMLSYLLQRQLLAGSVSTQTTPTSTAAVASIAHVQSTPTALAAEKRDSATKSALAVSTNGGRRRSKKAKGTRPETQAPGALPISPLERGRQEKCPPSQAAAKSQCENWSVRRPRQDSRFHHRVTCPPLSLHCLRLLRKKLLAAPDSPTQPRSSDSLHVSPRRLFVEVERLYWTTLASTLSTPTTSQSISSAPPALRGSGHTPTDMCGHIPSYIASASTRVEYTRRKRDLHTLSANTQTAAT